VGLANDDGKQEIYEMRHTREPRIVNVLVDLDGCKGKSTIASLMALEGVAIDLPPVNDGEKLVQSLLDMCHQRTRDPGVIFVDLPRSLCQDRLFGIFTAIEQVKKGHLYDFRYSYKSWWIHAPIVWVFMNSYPHMSYVSKDRWKLWEIDENDELKRIPYDEIVRRSNVKNV